jgi:hypothetical protein
MHEDLNDHGSIAGFLDKWRARWPEWRVAEVFVPAAQREYALAWFALRQELTDAAWAGADPRPGETKLGWWSEELLGWAQGRRRHPLGFVLQRLPAPWMLLGTCLPALRASRERPADTEQAIAVLEPFAEAVAGTAATLFTSTTPAPASSAVIGLLAERALLDVAAAVPLQTRARLGPAAAPQLVARAWAEELLRRWPSPYDGARPGRIHAAMVRERLARMAAGHAATPPARLTTLRSAWRAARG